MKISLSEDLVAGDSSPAGMLRDDGFKFYQVGTNLFITKWRHLVMLGQVIVPMEVEQYEGRSGRMLYSYITYCVPDGRVDELVEQARAESQVHGGMWVGREKTETDSARMCFGLIANENADVSELRTMILKVEEETRRVNRQLWESISSPRIVGGGAMAA